MAINFPSTAGQATDGSYTYTVAGIVYSWNGSSWAAAGAGASATNRSLFSVTTNAAGTPALSYSSATGVFSYTPPEAENDTFDDVVARGSTALRDVIFGDYTGATGAPKIHYVDSSHTLWFKPSSVGGDSASINLGNGSSFNNLEIKTTSAQAQLVVHNAGLFLTTVTANQNITLQSENDIYLNNGGQNAIKVLDNAQTNGDALSVELYWGSATTGGKKLETTTNGVTITGALTAGGLAYPTSNGTSGQVLTSDGAGSVTWTAGGLQSRATTGVTQSIAGGASADVSITAPSGYALLAIETSHAAWVTLYSDTASRTLDATRAITNDPLPGSGVLAEVITTGAATQKVTPGIICFNSTGAGQNTTYAKIENRSGSTNNITVTLTYITLEA